MGAIGVVGGVFLLWLGFGMCRDVIKGRISLELTKGGKKSSLGPILAGIITSISNPYWSLWWATVGLAYVLIAMKLGKIGLAFFFTGHILSDLVWYSLVAIALSLGRKLFSDKIYRGLVVICGMFLIGLGIYFAYSGVSFIT